MAHVNSWIESLKKHGGFGDARAKQLAKYFEAQGISNDEKAAAHAERILKRGEKLEHEETGILHKSIHDALKREFNLEAAAEAKTDAKERVDEAELVSDETAKVEAGDRTETEEAEIVADETAEVEAKTRKKATDAEIEADKIEARATEAEMEADKAKIKKAKAEEAAANKAETRRPQNTGGNTGNINPNTSPNASNQGSGSVKNLEELEGTSWALVVFAIIVWALDFFMGFDGFRIGMQLRRFSLGGFSFLAPSLSMGWGSYLIGIFLNPVFWTLITVIIIIKWGQKKEIISWSVFIYVIMIIAFGGGWKGNGIMHVVMALLFYFLILSKYYSDNIPKARYIFCAILFIDFFLYGIIQDFAIQNEVVKQIWSNRLIIPIWFYVSVGYASKIKGSLMTTLVILLIVLSNAFSVYGGIVDIRDFSSTVDPQQREDFKGYFARSKDNFQDWVDELFTDIKQSATEQLEYATGGYYKGKVEENKEEQLGVYLENVEAADTRFFENEQVIIWGDLEAKTLDKPIYIYMGCESDGVNGTITPPALANPEYFNNSEAGYKIEKLEQIGFECRFDPGLLKTGANNIKVKAEFNFETLAFLKTYFMDIERVRALRRENVNPLTEYGIKDKTPTAVFTNGPVRLGVGSVDPPVGVNAEDNAYSYIGVTVEKQWLGKIKDITEITIQVPDMLELETTSEDLFCRNDFEKVEENEEGYIVYKMTPSGIGKIKTPITDFRSWRCSITVPPASEVLGNTPVTTYYYRASAKYVYEVEKPLNVYIKSVVGEKTRLTACNVNCTDSDGCICNVEGCNLAKNSTIEKKFTCNNYKAGASYSKSSVESDFEYLNSVGQYIGAMMFLNAQCLKGDTTFVNESIDNSKGLTASKKKELKDFVVRGCEERSYRFFEITEDLIIDKVNSGVDRFKVLEGKNLGDEKSKANTKKGEFDTLLGRVIEHFEDNYDYVITEKNDDNIRSVKSKRNELDKINFN